MALIHQFKNPKSAQQIADELRANQQRPVEKIKEGLQEALAVAQGKTKPHKEHKPKQAGKRLVEAAKTMREEVKAEMNANSPIEPKRRGRPSSGTAKAMLGIRLEPHLVEAIKRTGDGWQNKVADILRAHFLP